MLDMYQLSDFISPVNKYIINEDQAYEKNQLGNILNETSLEDADVILLGCDEYRGAAQGIKSAADTIRKKLYNLYYWHKEVKIADIGNVKAGASLTDSYVALQIACKELTSAGKKVIIIGGSHDNTLAQYNAFCDRKKIIEAVVIDALIDLKPESVIPHEKFLLEMLTGQPNYIRHYNHLAFQSYFVNPDLLETIDKLRFDCFRVGKLKENIESVEPVIRNSNLLSFDINALSHTCSPGNSLSPNGLNGEEACKLMQYAGMSTSIETVGIYEYDPARDYNELTAMQIAQMIWYYFDGFQKQQHEAHLDDRSSFNEFNTVCAEVDTVFLQSKRTGRWWMQLPDKSFTACSYDDYITASHNDLPERWLRAQERN